MMMMTKNKVAKTPLPDRHLNCKKQDICPPDGEWKVVKRQYRLSTTLLGWWPPFTAPYIAQESRLPEGRQISYEQPCSWLAHHFFMLQNFLSGPAKIAPQQPCMHYHAASPSLLIILGRAWASRHPPNNPGFIASSLQVSPLTPHIIVRIQVPLLIRSEIYPLQYQQAAPPRKPG